ncbi:MAG: AbrB/MazE/SpoVT family DNA-binding domain-containing protein [Thiotrichales bacterium]|nr:AbrB/MazE/SpoVT family DNA-binding domain-containing protein [Thiotrichales bacterium]MCY4285952.1 AbrB/MazE/SpoVT family DNA-binding domain-containing protein [Thiotrichales bacterium]MCY4350885.1 AbrB/MazE/SpoVT family DNA-binding domain-containing protein [Thiotrichales bacterium]
MAITLTVTSKGQITLRKEVLSHLGVRPGDKLDIDLLADGRMQLRPKRGTSAAAVFGMLVKPQRSLSVEEISEIAASGWAGEE